MIVNYSFNGRRGLPFRNMFGRMRHYETPFQVREARPFPTLPYRLQTISSWEVGFLARSFKEIYLQIRFYAIKKIFFSSFISSTGNSVPKNHSKFFKTYFANLRNFDFQMLDIDFLSLLLNL